MSNNSEKNFPLSDLLPGLPTDPAVGAAEEPVNQSSSSGLLRRDPPINLPKYTFIHGSNEARCRELASLLIAQDESIFSDEFSAPVYDAIQSFFGWNYGEDIFKKVEADEKAKNLRRLIKGAVSWDDLTFRLQTRLIEVSEINNYRFLVSDAWMMERRITSFITSPTQALVISLDNGGFVMQDKCMELYYKPNDTLSFVLEDLKKVLK